MSALAFSTLTELSAGLAAGQYTSEDLTRMYLDRIRKANPKLHAYVNVDEDAAVKQAQAADMRRASGYSLGPLDGLPIAIKDLCEVEGQITTAGSQDWIERRSLTTCTAVEKLMQQGMVVLGKLHMVEFAFGGWGTNPVMGTPWNPWDLSTHRTPGGSSSGSGVAVAAGLCPAALGSDTGGSVRIPAALNGITGLKTTSGRISLHGAVALSGTLDTIGPMTRCVQDAALLTQAMAGPDPRDAGTYRAPQFAWRAPAAGAKPLLGSRIAVMPVTQFPIALKADVIKAYQDAIKVMADLGAEIIQQDLPFNFEEMIGRNGKIIAAEAFAIHRAYIEDLSRPIGEFVRARTLAGGKVSAADYIEALADHKRAIADWVRWMADIDALITPAIPFGAIPLTEVNEAITPMASFSRAGNYMGTCGLALPAGFADNGMPLGVQLLAKPFDEAALIRIGMGYQGATEWHRQHPDLSALGI